MKALVLALVGLLVVAPVTAAPPHVVFLVSEDPYNYEAVGFARSFSEKQLLPLGYRSTIVEGNQAQPTDLKGFVAAMKSADLLVVFVRRATPPQEQLDAIRAHLAAGKPLLGIRTANHAFNPPSGHTEPAEGLAMWPEFVPDVLGCQNKGYETRGLPYGVTLHPDASAKNPLLDGVDLAAIQGHSSLYRVLPLAEDAEPLLLGQAQGVDPAQPVAWTRYYGPAKARVFYTSFGAAEDMAQAPVIRLLVNAVQWTLAKK